MDNHEWSADTKTGVVYFTVACHYPGDWNRDSQTFLIAENIRLLTLKEPPPLPHTHIHKICARYRTEQIGFCAVKNENEYRLFFLISAHKTEGRGFNSRGSK